MWLIVAIFCVLFWTASLSRETARTQKLRAKESVCRYYVCILSLFVVLVTLLIYWVDISSHRQTQNTSYFSWLRWKGFSRWLSSVLSLLATRRTQTTSHKPIQATALLVHYQYNIGMNMICGPQGRDPQARSTANKSKVKLNYLHYSTRGYSVVKILVEESVLYQSEATLVFVLRTKIIREEVAANHSCWMSPIPLSLNFSCDFAPATSQCPRDAKVTLAP